MGVAGFLKSYCGVERVPPPYSECRAKITVSYQHLIGEVTAIVTVGNMTDYYPIDSSSFASFYITKSDDTARAAASEEVTLAGRTPSHCGSRANPGGDSVVTCAETVH
eukprot:750904-Hanusia_phi.AAC.1